MRRGVQGVHGIHAQGAPRDHDPVAQELVDGAAETPHVGHEGVEHRVELLGEVALGDVAFRGLGEAAEVQEQHGRVDGVVEDLGGLAKGEEPPPAGPVLQLPVAGAHQRHVVPEVGHELEALHFRSGGRGRPP